MNWWLSGGPPTDFLQSKWSNCIITIEHLIGDIIGPISLSISPSLSLSFSLLQSTWSIQWIIPEVITTSGCHAAIGNRLQAIIHIYIHIYIYIYINIYIYIIYIATSNKRPPVMMSFARQRQNSRPAISIINQTSSSKSKIWNLAFLMTSQHQKTISNQIQRQ